MAKFSLAVCLMLLVALSGVYEAQGANIPIIDIANITRMSKDFEPYAYKTLLDFVRGLEGKCPATAEFKDFFAKLRDYIDYCFKLAPSRSKDNEVELSGKFQPVLRAMSTLNGTMDGTSTDSWRLIDGLVLMERISFEMKKISPNEITLDEQIKLYGFLTSWYIAIGILVKKTSEMNGKSIDLSLLGINDDHPMFKPDTKFNKTQEPFSLPLYLENFPKIGKDFESFAYKGMLGFVGDLESKCPARAEFKNFFENLKNYTDCFKLDSPYEHERLDGIEVKILWNAENLYKAMSALNVTKSGTSNSWRLFDGLLSMREVLFEMKKIGSKQITFEQRRELTWSVVKWARGVSLFVNAASEKKGVSMDLSSFEKYYDSHVLVPSKGSRRRTRKDHPNDGNVPKGTSIAQAQQSLSNPRFHIRLHDGSSLRNTQIFDEGLYLHHITMYKLTIDSRDQTALPTAC